MKLQWQTILPLGNERAQSTPSIITVYEKQWYCWNTLISKNISPVIWTETYNT